MPGCLSKVICDNCDVLCHTWNPSCIGTFFDVLVACAKYSLKIYTIFYSVSFIVGRKGLEYFKKRFIREILQSSLFLTCNGAFYTMYFCLCRKILGNFNEYSIGFLPGYLASFSAILVEKKSRRSALALYMLNTAFDTIFNLLQGSGYVKELKYGEVVIFSITMALLMYMYSSDSLPDGLVKTILRKCFAGASVDNISDDENSDRLNRKLPTTERDVITIKNGVFLGSKVFCFASALHTVYSMLTGLPKLVKDPNDFMNKAVLKKNNILFGAWLGSYVGIYEIISKILKKYNNKGGHINNAVAGSLAGVSMLWYRNTSYALYIASKAIELLYMSGIDKGVVPYVKHFDSFLYAFCTALMFHFAMLQPLYLSSVYFRFLENLTGDKFMKVNRKPLEVFGYDSMRIHKLEAPNAYWGSKK